MHILQHSLWQKLLCAHTKYCEMYVHILQYSLWQKLCAHTTQTHYCKRYVHILQYSLWQKLCAHTTHTHYCKTYVHILQHFLWQKSLCAHTTHTRYRRRYVHILHILFYVNSWYVHIRHILIIAKSMWTYCNTLYGESCYVRISHILIIAKCMYTYCKNSLLQKLLCAHTTHTHYCKSFVYILHCYVHIMHILIVAIVMCTYCTYSSWQSYAYIAQIPFMVTLSFLHTSYTLYVKSYVYIMHILFMSKVTCTYLIYSLCQKLCVHTAHENRWLASSSVICHLYPFALFLLGLRTYQHPCKSHTVSIWWVPLDKGSAPCMASSQHIRGIDTHPPLSSIQTQDPSVRAVEQSTRLESWFVYLCRISLSSTYITRLHELRKWKCHEDSRTSGGVPSLTLNLTLYGLQGSTSQPGRFNPGRSVSAFTIMTSVGSIFDLDASDKS